MKKQLFIVLLAILVVAALCACGTNGNATQPNSDPTENQTQPEETTAGVTDPTAGTGEATEPQQPTTGAEDPTEPSATGDGTEPPATEEPTEPSATTTPTQPNEKPTEPEPSEPVSGGVTYYDYYYVFTAEQQMAFINSFDSIEDFFEWNKAAKEEYENERIPIDGTGPIILG